MTSHTLDVARFGPTLERNSFLAWLNAEITPCADGTARLRGWLGLSRAWSLLWPWMLLGNIIVFGGWIAFGLHDLASGRVGTGVSLMVIPAVVVVGEAAALRAGLRSLRTEATKLVASVETILS